MFRPVSPFVYWFPLLVALWLCAAPAARAQVGEGDFLVSLLGDALSGGPLPNGPLVSGPTLTSAIPALEPRMEGIAFSPEGELIGMQAVATEFPGPLQVGLFLIPASGELEFYGVGGTVPLEPEEFPVDFGFDPEGRLFVLVQWFSVIGPFIVEYRMLEIDPDTGEILGRHGLGQEVSRMTLSPRGFWLVGEDRLWHYNTETLVLDDPGIPLDLRFVTDASTDSTGALWLMSEPGFIDPPIFSLSRFDPVTGALRFGFYSTQAGSPLIAVRQGCVSSATVRCLMGGRFEAKIRWRDYDNREGDGQVAPSASADSGLFWFFEPSNWEVLVKVIDGCTRNGNFWVFTAGTTDVEYTLEVTDLKTGEVFTSVNDLGRAAPAVTQNRAFATCP